MASLRTLCRIVAVALALAVWHQQGAGQTSNSGERAERAVLFIGNSYTYYNNLPVVAQAFAEANECSWRSARATIPGATLGQHWLSGVAADSIRGRRWDLVVLQEQSLLGGIHVDGVPVMATPDTFLVYATHFGRLIREAGSRIVLLQTWARDSKPDDQPALDHAYFSVGRSIGATVVPAGIAWTLFHREHPHIALHNSDGSHPSAIGTYLAAAVLVRALCPASDELRTPATVTYDSIDGAGRVAAGRQLVLALPSRLRSQIAQAATQAVDSVRKAGGYLPTTAVPPATLPPLPVGRTPMPGALVGSWSGDVALNVPGVVLFDVTENTSTYLSGSIEVRLGKSSYHVEVARLPLEHGRFSIEVPLGQNAHFDFVGVYVNDLIAAEGRVILADRIRAVGRTRLARKINQSEVR